MVLCFVCLIYCASIFTDTANNYLPSLKGRKISLSTRFSIFDCLLLI